MHIYHKNYTEFGEPYQLVLLLNLEVTPFDGLRVLSGAVTFGDIEVTDDRLLQAFKGPELYQIRDNKKEAQLDTYHYFKEYQAELRTVCKNVDSILNTSIDKAANEKSHSHGIS